MPSSSAAAYPERRGGSTGGFSCAEATSCRGRSARPHRRRRRRQQLRRPGRPDRHPSSRDDDRCPPRRLPLARGDVAGTRSTASRPARARWSCSSTASPSRGTRGVTSSRRSPRPATGRWPSTCAATAGRRSPSPSRTTAWCASSPTTSAWSARSASETAVVVGHDWGAPIAWTSAMLRPDVFTAVAGLSVPFSPPSEHRPLAVDAGDGRGRGVLRRVLPGARPGRGRDRSRRARLAARLHVHRLGRRPAARPDRGDRRHRPARRR